jgi:hypothetical protein
MAIARKPNSKSQAARYGDERGRRLHSRCRETDRCRRSRAGGRGRAAQVAGHACGSIALLLAKVDAAAKRRGISRSAWIQFTVSRALDAGEG